jgi:hypothetical protein
MSRKANTELKDDLPSTVKELAKKNQITYEKQLELLGGSGGRLAVKPELEKGNRFAQFLVGDPLGETELVDGKLVSKYRPKNIGRFTAGVGDLLTMNLTDFDKRGGGFLGLYDQNIVSKLGGKAEDFKLSKSELDVLKEQKKVEEDANKGPFDDAEERLDFYEKNFDRISGLNRKLRRDAAIDAQLNYMATEPIRQAFANRAAEAAAQRGLRIRAAKEAMPSNIQNIMLSKQAQAATAASAEAERARAAADQQDAATRFAGLGMQRRFG